ncbi:hypothetical protein JW835_12685, partial [bacterium]|nr:hypothetical protein [bacterium]
DFGLGDYFGWDVVAFAKVVSDSIYVSVSRTQGQAMVKGSGELGSLTFTGLSKGSGEVEVDPAEVHFYDADGEEIVMTDLVVGDATITVE